VPEVELPPEGIDRLHAWHLFPIRLQTEHLSIDRNAFIRAMNDRGVGTAVHWRPLHMHPYYRDQFGWTEDLFPVASKVWERLISLPLFPEMTGEELDYVCGVIRTLCDEHRRK